jgi:methionyl-tRNA synthetase
VHCDHEYLNFKGAKLSKSRGAFVEVPYFLEKSDPDALRFSLTATAPETRDTGACPEALEGFSSEDFVEHNDLSTPPVLERHNLLMRRLPH